MDEREFDRRRNSSAPSRNNERSGAARDQPSEFPSAEVGASAAYPGVLVPISRGSDVGLHPDPTARFQRWRPVDEPISHSGGRRVTFDYSVAENPTDIVRYGQHARDGMRVSAWSWSVMVKVLVVVALVAVESKNSIQVQEALVVISKKESVLASSHHSNPEHEHVPERSGREHRLRSLPDIGLLRRIFKKRTVTTTVDEYEPDIGEYPGPRATTPDYRESSSPRYDPEDQILDRYSDGRRRLSIQQTGDAAVYTVDERPVRPASRRGAGVRKYSQPNVDYGIAREETQIPTREWRLQSEPNTGTLQRTTHNRNFDTEARYYSEGADFSHASRWRITDMRHAPSPHQIVGHEAVFDAERNTILIPARDTLRNHTLADDRQGNITMHQLPAHGVVVDGGSRWRDGETGFERLERRPSAVEFKDVRKHSEPIALYRGEAPDISRSEQRSQSLGIESLRLVRDTFAQRRHASQNHSVDAEKQPISLDSPQRERNRGTSDAAGDLRQSAAGELGPTSTSLSDGARPPKITGATGTDHTKEGILRNRKSNKAGLSKSKSLDQGDPIQETRRVRWSSLPQLDKPDGGDAYDSGLGRRTRSASTTGELGDFWYVDDVGESFGPEASDKHGESDDVEKQLTRAPKPGRRKSILEELRLVGIPVYVYKGLFSAAVGIILCFITAYLFFPDQADSETARVARVFTTPGILVAFAYTFYAVKYRDSAW